MNRLFTILLFFFSLISEGQETKKIKQDIKGTSYKEEYYVLKSAKSIRHGVYNKIDYNDAIVETGYYKSGLKDSIWTRYKRDGVTKLSSGTYLNDEKNGIWEYYDFRGNLEVKYNYSTNELIYYKVNDFDANREFKVLSGNDTARVKLDRPPIFIGSLIETIGTNIKYPALARENGKSGKVLISFIIDKNGQTKNHTVINGMGYGCDEEALRVIQEFLTFWSPGLLDGNPVDIEYVMPITFNLQ